MSAHIEKKRFCKKRKRNKWKNGEVSTKILHRFVRHAEFPLLLPTWSKARY